VATKSGGGQVSNLRRTETEQRLTKSGKKLMDDPENLGEERGSKEIVESWIC
jgi:hypothetical protein